MNKKPSVWTSDDCALMLIGDECLASWAGVSRLYRRSFWVVVFASLAVVALSVVRSPGLGELDSERSAA